MVVPLKPLHDLFKIKRIVVSTYQSVSGTGRQAIEELENQVKAFVSGEKPQVNVYPHQIAFNVLPHIDSFLENGYTKEELKMVRETHKILNDTSLQISPTAVRVPVFNCHAEALILKLKTLPEIARKEILQKPLG